MTKQQLIERLQEQGEAEDEVFALTSDGDGYEIQGVELHRGILCIVEGDVAEFPEAEAEDDEDDEDDESAGEEEQRGELG